MHLFKYLALTALSLTAVSARKAPSASKFNTYLAQQAVAAPIELDETAYAELTTAPRDYSFAVLLTARAPKYSCGICREFDPEWKILGSSWHRQDKTGQHRVLYGTLDFDQGKNVFLQVCPPTHTPTQGASTIHETDLTIAPTTNRTSPLVLPSYHRPTRQIRLKPCPLRLSRTTDSRRHSCLGHKTTAGRKLP